MLETHSGTERLGGLVIFCAENGQAEKMNRLWRTSWSTGLVQKDVQSGCYSLCKNCTGSLFAVICFCELYCLCNFVVCVLLMCNFAVESVTSGKLFNLCNTCCGVWIFKLLLSSMFLVNSSEPTGEWFYTCN